jgi:hypothetical protein
LSSKEIEEDCCNCCHYLQQQQQQQQQMGRHKPKRTSEDDDKKVEAKKTRQDEEKGSEDDKESDDSKESEEIVRENPHALVWAPDGVSKYIVRKYTNTVQGTDIPYSCAVTSRNGRLFGKDEVMDFWRKSTAACPTYGVFYWCFGGGPSAGDRQTCTAKCADRKIGHTKFY